VVRNTTFGETVCMCVYVTDGTRRKRRRYIGLAFVYGVINDGLLRVRAKVRTHIYIQSALVSNKKIGIRPKREDKSTGRRENCKR